MADLRAAGARIVLITRAISAPGTQVGPIGLGDLFDAVDIVSDKTPGTYARISLRAKGAAAR